MGDFRIHEQLSNDCHRLGRFQFCHLLLNRNAVLPWFILVPETDVADLLDLPADLRRDAIDEAASVSRFVKDELGLPKVNFGAIGNLVPQMHLHVIGRRPGDACWPAPVWGNLDESADYPPDRIGEMTTALATRHGLQIA